MKQKHVDAMREVRLWLGQVIVPAGLVIGTIIRNPDAREYISQKYGSAKKFIKAQFNKEA